jgi:hypothetical protein
MLAFASPAGASTVDLLNQANVRIDGESMDAGTGFSVAPAGDVNGDGRDDIVVAGFTSHNSRNDSGSVYVIYGSASPTNVDLNNLGTAGFRIDGAAAGDEAATRWRAPAM